MSDLQTLVAEFIKMHDGGLPTRAGFDLRKGLAKLKDSPVPKMRVTDEMVEAARFTLTGICGFAITSATVRRTLESALSATATEGE